MSKKHLRLQFSESIIARTAAEIYSAYIIAGKVLDGDETKWMERSIREALEMATAIDEAVVSDDEL